MNLTQIVPIFLLLFASAVFSGLVDKELFVNQYCKGNKEWRKKYQEDTNGRLVPPPDTWYYRTFNLKWKERFPLSATVLVGFTDRFHNYKMFQHLTKRLAVLWVLLICLHERRFFVAMSLYCVLWCCDAVGFHVFYSLL